MSDEQKQTEAKNNFNNASSYLMKSNSFKNLDEKAIKDIEFLTEAFQIIFEKKSFILYFYVEQKVNNYFKNVLNQIILNALKQQINNENLIELMTNFFTSVIKLLFIYEINPYLQYIKVIRKIFSAYKDNYSYYSKINDITFWQFNKKNCSEFIKNIEQKPEFKPGDKVEVLIENYNKKGIDRLVWMEGIIKKIENETYYILYNGEDEQNNEICYPIGYPTVRSSNYDNWNWRLNLKKGDKIYAYKESKKEWIVSTINDVIKENGKNGFSKIKYKIGFGVYLDSKSAFTFLNQKYEINTNENRNVFIGEVVDEYIYHFSKKIQRIGIFNKDKIKSNEEFSFNQVKAKLDDMILYNKDEKNNIIIGRIGTFSYNYATLLKNMEKENIFNDFLNVLDDENNKNPEIISTIYLIFYCALEYLHDHFIKEKEEIFKKGYSRFPKTKNSGDDGNINLIKAFLDEIKNISVDLKSENESEKTYSENNSNSSLNNLSINTKKIDDILEMIKSKENLDDKDIDLLIENINQEQTLIKIIDNLIENKEKKAIDLLIDIITKNKICINIVDENSFDKAKNKFEICKIYFEIIVRLNEINLSNNYFAKFLNSALNDKYNLKIELFELYKNNLDIESHCLFSFKLLNNFFKSDLIKKNSFNEGGKFTIAENNKIYNLSDKNKSLIPTYEKNFKNYILKIKDNTNIKDEEKIYQEDNIKERLNFLDTLIEIYPDYNFIHLFESYLVPEDKKYFYEYIENYFYEYIEKFFDENMNKNRNDIFLELFNLMNLKKEEKKYSFDKAKIYIRLLYYKYKKIFDLNIIKGDGNDENYEIKFNYDNQQNKEFIFDIFWNFLLEVENEKIIKKILNILLQIYNNDQEGNADIKEIIYKISDKLDECDYQYQNESDIKTVKKCYELLKILFIETEKDLNISIKPHFSLLKNCLIKLPLEIKNNEDNTKNDIELFYGNSTLYEIKEQLGKKYKKYHEYIETYIKKGEKEILLDYTYNHKSLYEIIKEFNIINDKKPMNTYIYFKEKEAVFLKGNELIPKLKNIIEESFNNATNYEEIMQPKDFLKFMNPNIKKYFLELNRLNQRDYLTKDEIYEFYIQKIKSGKEEEVEKDLKDLGYDKYLVSKSEENAKTDNKKLFRYHLSNINNENLKNNFLNDFIQNYNHINPKIDYNLFFFLPTSEYYYNKFLAHEDKIYQEIKSIFDDEKQVLFQLYYLIIIESFLQDIECEYIEIDDIFNQNNTQKLKLLRLDYKPFDSQEIILKKINFIGIFINGDSYITLIEYAKKLMNNKLYKTEEIYKECLLKSLKIIKAIYLSLTKKNNLEIKSNIKKEKNIYYIDYRNIYRIQERYNLQPKPGISYSDLVKNLINFITSDNIKNKSQMDLLLFEECLELIILIISTKQKIFSDLEKSNESNKSIESNGSKETNESLISKISKVIKEEIISKSIFVVEKLLDSLNYISVQPSESKYTEYLYNIILLIYSSINDRIITDEINYIEFYEFFIEFIKYIYNDNDFKKDDLISKLIEILINYAKNSNDNVLSDELFFKYISLFNDYLLDFDQIRKKIFSFRLESDSLISSIYENIIKESNNKFLIIEKIDDKEFIKLGNDITKKKIQNICKKFLKSCFEKEKINNNSISDFALLYSDLIEVQLQNKDLKDIETRSFGYVGLKNLSSTCYMNSVLQQLFMIHILKYAIIGTSKISNDDKILKELQILFANLQFSEKKYYNPINFSQTNIFNNQPIDVHKQQDCKEFYDSFCDALEKCLKNTKYKYIINDALMGYMSHSIKCESCDYTSYNIESFCDLSLEVKNINNLVDSLKNLIKEEKVEDFVCNNCNKIVNIRKRITLSKLPNTLFFHLKRFDYNDESVKIYSIFNFPHEINLKEFCSETFQEETNEIYKKTDDYYKYILKGVVQHSGTAKGGHYISFIDVNRDGKGNILNIANNLNNKKWIQFNDSIVSEFNVDDLPYETIGNINTSKTAYLLIYERINKSPIKIVIDNEDFNMDENHQNIININEKELFNKKYDIYYKNSHIKEQDLYNLIFHNKIKIKGKDKDKDEYYDEYYKYIPYYSINKEVPQNLYNSIKEENNSISTSKNNSLLSSIYYSISSDNLSNYFDSEDSLKSIELKNINEKYIIITMIITDIFNKRDSFSMIKDKNEINRKFNNFTNIINKIISSEEKPKLNLLVKLLSFISEENKLDRIFIGNNYNGNDFFDKKNIELLQKLIIKSLKIISENKDESRIEQEKINKIVNTFEQYFNYHFHMKKNEENNIFNEEEEVLKIVQKIKSN